MFALEKKIIIWYAEEKKNRKRKGGKYLDKKNILSERREGKERGKTKISSNRIYLVQEGKECNCRTAAINCSKKGQSSWLGIFQHSCFAGHKGWGSIPPGMRNLPSNWVVEARSGRGT